VTRRAICNAFPGRFLRSETLLARDIARRNQKLRYLFFSRSFAGWLIKVSLSSFPLSLPHLVFVNSNGMKNDAQVDPARVRVRVQSSIGSSPSASAHGSPVALHSRETWTWIELWLELKLDWLARLPASHLLFYLKINLHTRGGEEEEGRKESYPRSCDPAIDHASKFSNRSRDGHYGRAIFSPPSLPSRPLPIKSRDEKIKVGSARGAYSHDESIRGHDSLPLCAFIIRRDVTHHPPELFARSVRWSACKFRATCSPRGSERALKGVKGGRESTPTHK